MSLWIRFERMKVAFKILQVLNKENKNPLKIFRGKIYRLCYIKITNKYKIWPMFCKGSWWITNLTTEQFQELGGLYYPLYAHSLPVTDCFPQRPSRTALCPRWWFISSLLQSESPLLSLKLPNTLSWHGKMWRGSYSLVSLSHQICWFVIPLLPCSFSFHIFPSRLLANQREGSSIKQHF